MGFPKSSWMLLGLCLLVALPRGAIAGSVYLNGVNIDGVTNQKFEKCTVRIDEHGNVFIEAAGYAVKAVEGAQAARPPSPAPSPAREGPTPTRITKRYFLVAEQSVRGMAEYDVDVYLNAKWLMTVKNNIDQEVIDITRHLLPGRNTVTFEAKKISSGPRKSFSPEHTLKITIGEGNESGGNVMIDNPLVSFTRTAADSESVSKDYPFSTR
jgi:hypothetical protein